MEIFNSIIVYPLLNVLVTIYQGLLFLHVPYPLGFSIIGLTIVIRIVLYPLINAQLKASKKMQDIAPHVSNLKSKHKGDNKRIQQETMKLYKEHGVNPAAGCLPTLIQLPVLFGLYNVLNNLVHKSPSEIVDYINSIVYFDAIKLNAPWESTFFGVPLGQSPQQLLAVLPVIAISIPLLTGLFQFIQSKMMFPTPPAGPKGQKNDDFAAVFQKQSVYIFPLMIGFFSFSFPFGLSLYWITFSIFGIIQQYKISGLGGLNDLWLKVKKTQQKKK